MWIAAKDTGGYDPKTRCSALSYSFVNCDDQYPGMALNILSTQFVIRSRNAAKLSK